MVPTNLRYHKEHEWIRVEGRQAVLGISDYAQDALGDIVYVELPKPGATVTAGQEIGEIESTKTTSSLYSPVAGTIVKVNEELKTSPELINDEPYEQGWMAVIELANPAQANELMDAAQYEEYLASLKT